jgi:soluble lytic murein transglycosylase-like protein
MTRRNKLSSPWLVLALVIGLAASSRAAPGALAERMERDPAQPSAVELCNSIIGAAQQWSLPTSFFMRLIWQESRFDAAAVSPKGAQGIAQFMPGTASERGLADPHAPADALRASARFLSELRADFGNLGLAAAAYNAGPQGIRDWLGGKRHLPAETQEYVLRITGTPAAAWTGAGDEYSAEPADPKPACLALASSRAGLQPVSGLEPVRGKDPDEFCARLAAIGAGCVKVRR